MTDLFDNPLVYICTFICGIVLFTVVLIVGMSWIKYTLQAYPIEVTQNGALIYDGIKSCVSIESSGDTTTITIQKGFLCLFPKSTITGRNIEVKTK